MNRESSLTAPSDRNTGICLTSNSEPLTVSELRKCIQNGTPLPVSPDDIKKIFERLALPLSEQHEPVLTREQTESAKGDLIKTDFLKKYPTVERRFADPPVHGQNIGLVSFVPAKGATPNEKGIYGFVKLRGNYNSETEGLEASERIIREHDSYHKIFMTRVGRPFPLTTSSDYSANVSEVDLKKDMNESVSADVKSKKEKDEKDIREIQEREQELLKDVKRDETDPELKHDEYITLRVKKAQLSWAWLENTKKLEEVKASIIKARNEIDALDRSNPEFKESYFNKYMEARRNAGLSTAQHADNFIKYMAEDAPLPF
jgi:hypothetical protein